MEEQRRKITEALRSLGEELDPQSRREAEAFAYEGRLPGERAASLDAVAVATGKETNSDSLARRSVKRSDSTPIDAAERRRLGREYLARRNQEMLDRQKKGEATQSKALDEEKVSLERESTNSGLLLNRKADSSSDFDSLLNPDGTLKETGKALPDPPTSEPVIAANPASFVAEMVGLGNAWLQSSIAAGPSGLQAGSRYANPFGDEFEMSDPSAEDRSATPKPPVPPKIALDQEPTVSVTEVPETPTSLEEHEADPESLTYEEQLARALSLSLAETEARARSSRERDEEENDPELAAALAESRRTAEEQRAREDRVNNSREAQWIQQTARLGINKDPGMPAPLVDISADPPVSVPPQLQTGSSASFYREMFDPEPLVNSEDELYSVSPRISNARPVPISPISERLQNPIGEAITTPSAAHVLQQPTRDDNVAPTTPSTANLSSDDEEESDCCGIDFLSEEDDFASLPGSADQARSETGSQSEASIVEVEDVDIDSVSSDEDDGIRTPGSWTDVGSEVGDSERSESEAGDAHVFRS